MTEPLRILHVEDSPTDCKLVVQALRAIGRPIEHERVEDAEGMRAAFARVKWDVVLSDWSMPRFSGPAALALFTDLQADIPFIIVSGTVGEEHAVAAMRAGAHDYVLKGALARLAPAVERELRENELRRAHRQALKERSEAEQRVRRLIDSTLIGVWFFDAHGATTSMNARMARMLGLTAEEAPCASLQDFVLPEDAPAIAERHARRRMGVSESYEQRLRRKDGSILWSAFEASPLFDQNGTFEGIVALAMDVTERRTADEKRREADLRFRRLFESGIVGITITERTGAITEANQTFLEMLGYTKDDLRARSLSWRGLTPRRWDATHAQTAASLDAQGRSLPFEKEYLHKNGSPVPVLVGVATLDENRSITVVIDLTHRRRAEAIQRESEARFRRIIETTNEGAWVIDAEGRTVFMNARMTSMLGRDADEALPLSPAEFLDEDGRALFVKNIELLRAGRSVQADMTLWRKDGAGVSTLLGASPMFDASGRYEGAFAMVMDVTERKRAEDALRERMRIAAMTGDVGLVLARGEGLRETLSGCVTAMVDCLGGAAARIWTLGPDGGALELQASAGALAPAEDAHIPLGNLDIGQIAANRRPHLTNDLPLDGTPGTAAWARREGVRSFAGHPLIAGGELVGVIAAYGRDAFTEATLNGLGTIADGIAVWIRGKQVERAKAALEDQFRQAQKMEAVGRLAGGVAHDFNNVLSVVLSYSEMLLQDLGPDDPMHEDLREILMAGRRAADLTRQLLTFSRQQVMEPRVLDLNDVLVAMDRMLKRLIGEDVDLATLPSPEVGHVMADPGQIEQVIMNLVVNARDAMPTGGKLTIETANVVLTEDYAGPQMAAKAGRYAKLTVADTGCGMDGETSARAFEPFFTTKPRGKGTGLGLSTVFGIVQRSGGHVWLHSEPGAGTTFEIFLPCVDAEADVLTAQTAPATLQGSETILLVEDEEQVRKVAMNVLGQHGYRVLAAQSAEDATSHCESHDGPIALLLTDVVMPQTSGPELARRLGGVRPEMRVLFMSGYTDDGVARHGLIDARAAFLQKPLTPMTLLGKVREVLDSTQPR